MNYISTEETRGGVYKIVDTVTGKFYVGSAVNLRSRIRKHARELQKGTHHNAHLQRIWGLRPESLRVEVVLVCGQEEAVSYEQKCIDSLAPTLNMTKIAGSFLGMKLSAEARAKISAANKGKPRSEEFRKNLSRAKMGKPGTPWSDEMRAMMLKLHTGRVKSEETRARISAAKKGKKIKPFTQEHRDKISAASRAVDRSVNRFVVTIGEVVYDGYAEAAKAFSVGVSTVKYWAKVGKVTGTSREDNGVSVTARKK